MPKAARLGDTIGHTPPGDGPVGGIGDVTGKIIGPCSTNVFTNGIPAARAFVDMSVCALHPQAQLPIATGSPKVFINALPAARVSDKIVCRAYITNGSANVFIGGGGMQTNAFMPEGLASEILGEVLEIAQNGATLVLGAGEIVVGGFYNSVVRIGAGLASIPYLLDSADAAVGVQKGIAESLNYNFKSDGAKQIGEALKPVGTFVQEKVTEARDFSEEKIGLGATAIAFGTVEAGVEIAGVVTGGKALKTFIDVPLESATRAAAASTRAISDEAAALRRIGVNNSTPAAQLLHQKINLRGAVAEEYARLGKGLSNNQIKKEIGPVLAGVMDTKTGKVFFGVNKGIGEVPRNMVPALADRLPAAQKIPYIKTRGAGTHAEIHALNEGMLNRPGAQLSDFLVYTINSGQKGPTAKWGMPVPRCPHCEHLTEGTKYFPETLRYKNVSE